VKIAITADNHLTTRARNPERFQTLINIFNYCGESQIKLLIIAGDLFDESMPNYGDFESVYKKHRPSDLNTAIIPGNHDPWLSQEKIAVDGIVVHQKPQLLPLNRSWNILFIPYQQNQSMGSVIAPFAEELQGKRWILIGHGDWSPGTYSSESYEPGFYMPLTRSDLILYKPELVFLGHIHKPFDEPPVHYPGSPCPLNKSEVGLRRLLLLDLKKGKISPVPVNSPLLYFKERFVMVSQEHELEFLENKLEERIKSWELPDGWEKRVQAIVEIAGFTANREAVKEKVKEVFSSLLGSIDYQLDLSQLYNKPDLDRELIAFEVQEWISNLTWAESTMEPNNRQILEEALKVIYGVE
jgi:DNA repair exonuclease SbcCD nuclease subunit